MGEEEDMGSPRHFDDLKIILSFLLLHLSRNGLEPTDKKNVVRPYKLSIFQNSGGVYNVVPVMRLIQRPGMLEDHPLLQTRLLPQGLLC